MWQSLKKLEILKMTKLLPFQGRDVAKATVLIQKVRLDKGASLYRQP